MPASPVLITASAAIILLPGVGLQLLAGYVFLSWRYWFSVPFRSIVVATVCYVIALAFN